MSFVSWSEDLQFQPLPCWATSFARRASPGNPGPAYAALEGRSMMIGSLALCLYSVVVCQLLKRYEVPALIATLVSLIAWTLAALCGKWLLIGVVG